jgi:Zn-dependent M28 family amino/carboxypeptidase
VHRAFTAALFALAACSSPTPPVPASTPPPAPKSDPLSAAELMSHVRALTDPRLEGRAAASEGERAATTYVADRARAMGLAPTEQAVRYKTGSHNLYARIEGTNKDELVVIGAHLDHLGRRDGALYPGADDNASGVALVLGIAATLADRRSELGRSVLVVWFGAEEPGMIGSQQFVAEPPVPLANIAVMVNIDMIGRPLLDQPLYRAAMGFLGVDAVKSVGLVGARHYPGLRALADAAFTASDGEIVAAEDLPDDIGDEVERQSRGRGDSVPFEEKGIPGLFFGDGESTDYHQPTDTIDKLTPSLLERRARTLVRVVIDLSRAPKSAFSRSDAIPPKRKPVPHSTYGPERDH